MSGCVNNHSSVSSTDIKNQMKPFLSQGLSIRAGINSQSVLPLYDSVSYTSACGEQVNGSKQIEMESGPC